MESAESIVSVMTNAGLEATADTYTTLACGYAKKGDIDTISNLLQKCEESEIYLVDKDYLDIIHALALNGYTQHVPIILNRVRKVFGYNQDAINAIYRLINNGLDEAALLILESIPRNAKPDGSLQNSGIFFIKQLVKAKRSFEKIVEYCKMFVDKKLHDRPLLLATEISLQQGNETLAYALMEELQNSGHEIRQHFFWPLILAKANSDPTGNSIIEVLISMGKFNVTPSSETIRDYVIPNIKGKSSEVLSKLRLANISVGSSACNLVYSLLQKNEIDEAAIIISKVPAYYHPEMIKRQLSNAFYKTQNLEAYVTILQYVRENLDRRERFVDHDDKDVDDNELIGHFVWDLTSNWRGFLDHAETVLSALVSQGLSIDSATAERIQNKLGEKLTPEISNLLDKMTSGELTPVPVVKKPPVYTPSDKMNIPQLETLIHNLQAKGQDTLRLSRQLLTLYCRAKDLEKAETLLSDLETRGFKYTVGVYAQLIELYSHHENIDKTLEYYNKLKEEMDNNISLDDLKVIKVVGLLIKNNRFNEAIELINEQTGDRKSEGQPFQYTTQCWRTLNMLAEQGKPEELDTLFNLLVKKEFIEVNNVMLGPLIKVHLVQNNLDKALEKFEWCCNQFRATPWKNELACKLIQIEDAEKLQKLTDLSTSVHGEINSLYDLVFAFVECGRIRQARKILETPGLQTRPQRINSACQRYQMEDMVKTLEGLKDATKDLNHIDRSDIYYQLLLSYMKHEDTDKALGLWMQMQEEDLSPNDIFLQTLGDFLIKNNVPVPFVMPQSQPATTKQIKILQRPKDEKNSNGQFRQSLKGGNLDDALVIKQNLRDPLSVTDASNLIEQLVHKERLQEATKITLELLNRSLIVVPRVFRFLLNNLAHKGDVENLTLIGTRINHETKKLLSFDNRVCHANLVAGNAAEYLNTLDHEITNVKEGEIVLLAEKFPRGGVLGIMEKHPELIDKYESIAMKYAQHGIIAPLNVLWSYYFVEGQLEKAKNIWENHLQNSPRLMFQRVIQIAREKSDENMVKRLIDQLKSSTVTQGAIGNAYSCLLDILVAKNKDEETVATFETAVNDVSLDYINRTALNRVKNVYLKMNKPFNYEIPAKKSQTSSTLSHSSDDDVIPQK